jgi:hypothetical protein
MDSNPRPAPYRGAALPTELTEQMNKRRRHPSGRRRPVSHRSQCQTAGPKAGLSSRFNLLLEHDVFRKPVPTFRHHARGPSTRAAARARADTRNFQIQKGDWCRTHASAGRVTRVKRRAGLCVEFRGPLPSCLSAEGFARRRVNPVVATLARVGRSPIGRARPRARSATRSIG